MKTFLSLVVFVLSIINKCNAVPPKNCLAFSGGGIRAAMGAYWTMNAIETAGKLDEIKCVSVISGGSWGFIMWLYEANPLAVETSISDWIDTHNKEWGTGVPSNGWNHYWDNWIAEITRAVVGVTGPGLIASTRFDTLRTKLDNRGLTDVIVYFVVEQVIPHREGRPRAGTIGKSTRLWRGVSLGTFVDYCWFKVEPNGLMYTGARQYIFDCARTPNPRALSTAGIDRKKETDGPVIGPHLRILDALGYASSAWATVAGQVDVHGQSGPVLYFMADGSPPAPLSGLRPDQVNEYRLCDAGGTFNDPLIPYMMDDQYKNTNNFRIWNFDFSGGDAQSFTEFAKLRSSLALCNKAIPAVVIPTTIRPKQRFLIDDRIIIHVPLWGEILKGKMIKYFPTMHKVAFPKKWSMNDFIAFKAEWKPIVTADLAPSVDGPGFSQAIRIGPKLHLGTKVKIKSKPPHSSM